MISRERKLAVLLFACTLLALPACTRGPRNFENENDALRKSNLDLRRQLEETEARLDRRLAELDALRQQQDGAAPIPGADLPTLATLAFGRYSGPVDTNEDGRDDELRLYVTPRDQHDRFLPVTGKATVQVIDIVPDEAPREITSKTWEPKSFDTTYRSGFMGTHYTLKLPLPAESLGDAASITVKLTFRNAATGAKHEAQAAYAVQP